MPDASSAISPVRDATVTPCDVFVAGGGPAGSTIAALLAARGFDVALVDKDKHPRFHIGESLLPFNVPLFEQLGVDEQMRDTGMLKLGIEFVSPYHEKGSQCLTFADGWDKSKSYSYQVRRSEFDHILLKNAAAKGAQVSEDVRVGDVEFLEGGGALVTAKESSGETRFWKAKFFVDATGRDTLLAGKLELKQRNARHNSAAMYGHFTGFKRLEGAKAGNITIFWFDHGWFWAIPLADGTTSIGAVCKPDYFKTRQGDLDQFFHDTIALCPPLAERLAGAKLTHPVTGTGNYSYRASRMSGPGYIMLGDAFAFIDPVFSSGVYLAMRSGFLGADTVEQCLRNPRYEARALRRFDRETRRGIDTFSWFIYRITTPAIRNLFMNPNNRWRLVEAVLGLLSGDVARDSPIRSRLMLFKAIYYVNLAAMRLRGRKPAPLLAVTQKAEERQLQAA